jgi:hypothetical protein
VSKTYSNGGYGLCASKSEKVGQEGTAAVSQKTSRKEDEVKALSENITGRRAIQQISIEAERE